MTRMQIWTKILLAVLGLYCAFQLLQSGIYIYPLVMVYQSPEGLQENIIFILFYIILFLISVIFIYQLLFRGQKWAQRIVGPDTLPDSPDKDHTDWIPIYRLAFLCCGVLMLFWAIPSAARLVYAWFLESREEFLPTRLRMNIFNGITTAIRFALALYLILGAPHLLRWHLSKSKIEQQP